MFRRLEGALDSACSSRFCKDDKFGLKPEQRALYLHLAMLWMKVLFIRKQWRDIEINNIIVLARFSGFRSVLSRGKDLVQRFPFLAGQITVVPQ